MQTNNTDFIMLPTVDFCFKELMKNPKVRKGFIAALLQREPQEIRSTEILSESLERCFEDDKQGYLDVRILLSDGIEINMEMQVKYYKYWDERLLFYLTRMFTSQIQKGDSYGKLNKCVHISILDFIRFPEDKKCYRKIHLRDDADGTLYNDKLEIQILELKKLPPDFNGDDEVINWMKFLSGKSREEFENMAKTNEYIEEAYDNLLHLSADEQKRLEYQAREDAIRDYNTMIEGSREMGLEEGIKEGIRVFVEAFQEFGIAQDQISAKLSAKYDLSREEADAYVLRYWK